MNNCIFFLKFHTPCILLLLLRLNKYCIFILIFCFKIPLVPKQHLSSISKNFEILANFKKHTQTC